MLQYVKSKLISIIHYFNINKLLEEYKMNIIFDNDIIQFTKYNELEKNIRLPLIEKYFEKKFTSNINYVGIDISRINEIHIIPINQMVGKLGSVKPITINNTLHFDISFADNILYWSEDKSHSKYKYANSVIVHEFYHCKEMLITSQYIDYKKIFFYDECATTYDYVLELARTLFSEYYAYYYSSNIYSEDINYNLKQVIHDSSIALSALHNKAKEDNEVYVPEEFMEKIKSFIYRCVKHIAQYHYTNDIHHLQVFDNCKDNELYRFHYDYFIHLNPILREMFSQYPQQMSDNFLLSFGKKLLSIFNYYSLDFSTNDLSDTFYFKFVNNLVLTDKGLEAIQDNN